METFEKEKQIIQYLDKKYVIKENCFITKYGDEHHWGYEIAEELPKIFSFEFEFCKIVLTQWAIDNDLDRKNLDKAWGSKKLKVKWSPEMAQELQLQYGITTAEEQLTKMLADEIAKEIDAEILSDLREQLSKADDLFGVVKCLGYEPTLTTYDPNSFVPRKQFVSTKYHDMLHERQNNPLWQDWIRTSELD
jgi:hypothetical protein